MNTDKIILIFFSSFLSSIAECSDGPTPIINSSVARAKSGNANTKPNTLQIAVKLKNENDFSHMDEASTSVSASVQKDLSNQISPPTTERKSKKKVTTGQLVSPRGNFLTPESAQRAVANQSPMSGQSNLIQPPNSKKSSQAGSNSPRSQLKGVSESRSSFVDDEVLEERDRIVIEHSLTSYFGNPQNWPEIFRGKLPNVNIKTYLDAVVLSKAKKSAEELNAQLDEQMFGFCSGVARTIAAIKELNDQNVQKKLDEDKGCCGCI